MKIKKTKADPIVIGWREWVGLPEFGIKKIKAKVDTGARTSALHAEDIEIYTRGKRKFVKFTIHPLQDSKKPSYKVKAPLLEKRTVKSSVGTKTLRPVIIIDVKIGEDVYPIEITLVNRDVMGFRMLIGRQALRKKFLIDPGKSFLSSKPVKKIKKTKKI